MRASSGRGREGPRVWLSSACSRGEGWKERGGKRPPWAPGPRVTVGPRPSLAPPPTRTTRLILPLIGSGGRPINSRLPRPLRASLCSPRPQGHGLAHHWGCGRGPGHIGALGPLGMGGVADFRGRLRPNPQVWAKGG